MKFSLRHTLAIGATALFLASCGDQSGEASNGDGSKTDSATPAETKSKAADKTKGPKTIAEATAGPSKVAVWKTGDEDTIIYLLGTVHILQPDIEWKNATFQSAWDASDAVFLEADVTSPEAMNEAASLIPEYGFNPPGTTLSSYYTEEELARINDALPAINVSIEMLDPLRPWLAGVQVGNLAMTSIGGRPEAGLEMILSAEADATGKTKRYFETLRDQVEILANGDDEDQARLFLEGIDDVREPEAFFARLVGTWYTGDEEGLTEILLEALEGTPEVADDLLYKRNEDWAAQLDDVIKTETGTFMVAVGAAHLVGDKSVQDYLETHGHSTERLN